MSDPAERLHSAPGSRYRIERELGEGGTATAYLSEAAAYDVHPEGGRFVVAQFVSGDDTAAIADPNACRSDSALDNVYLVTNWFQVLEERAPLPGR